MYFNFPVNRTLLASSLQLRPNPDNLKLNLSRCQSTWPPGPDPAAATDDVRPVPAHRLLPHLTSLRSPLFASSAGGSVASTKRLSLPSSRRSVLVCVRASAAGGLAGRGVRVRHLFRRAARRDQVSASALGVAHPSPSLIELCSPARVLRLRPPCVRRPRLYCISQALRCCCGRRYELVLPASTRYSLLAGVTRKALSLPLTGLRAFTLPIRQNFQNPTGGDVSTLWDGTRCVARPPANANAPCPAAHSRLFRALR